MIATDPPCALQAQFDCAKPTEKWTTAEHIYLMMYVGQEATANMDDMFAHAAFVVASYLYIEKLDQEREAFQFACETRDKEGRRVLRTLNDRIVMHCDYGKISIVNTALKQNIYGSLMKLVQNQRGLRLPSKSTRNKGYRDSDREPYQKLIEKHLPRSIWDEAKTYLKDELYWQGPVG